MTDHDRRLIAELIRELQALREDLRALIERERQREAEDGLGERGA
jgi:hypothetical protein